MFRVVGLGPGSVDLVTIRAAEVLKRADVVYVPKSKRGAGLARKIVERYTEGEVVELEVEMGGEKNWAQLAKTIERGRGERVYALLGDPGLYSTFAKLSRYIQEPVEYVPGVSAVISCVLKTGRALAQEGQAVAIIPAERVELIKLAAQYFDSVVVVKANTNIDFINTLLKEKGGAAVRRCYTEEEVVAPYISWSDYFTTVYIWP